MQLCTCLFPCSTHVLMLKGMCSNGFGVTSSVDKPLANMHISLDIPLPLYSKINAEAE